MSKIVNVCIVGCGRIASLNALGYLRHPGARLLAVCDVNEERARLRQGNGRGARLHPVRRGA